MKIRYIWIFFLLWISLNIEAQENRFYGSVESSTRYSHNYQDSYFYFSPGSLGTGNLSSTLFLHLNSRLGETETTLAVIEGHLVVQEFLSFQDRNLQENLDLILSQFYLDLLLSPAFIMRVGKQSLSWGHGGYSRTNQLFPENPESAKWQLNQGIPALSVDLFSSVATVKLFATPLMDPPSLGLGASLSTLLIPSSDLTLVVYYAKPMSGNQIHLGISYSSSLLALLLPPGFNLVLFWEGALKNYSTRLYPQPDSNSSTLSYQMAIRGGINGILSSVWE